MISLLLLLAGAQPQAPAPDPQAAAVLDTAMARMGGASSLRAIERVRYELVTQWQRPSFDGRPYPDQPSYEWHTDLRDYTIPAWRNTRRFGTPTNPRAVIDLVRDSVAIRSLQDRWAPLNVAYVDERRELFAFSPERLLPLMRSAGDLRLGRDTTIAGVPAARVSATVAGFPATLFVRRSDELPAMVRYTAAQPNDFGLAPWGPMEVEVWFSRWQPTGAGVALPMQWDVRRAGAPYKRITVAAASFDGVAAPDSFAVSDSLRQAFLADARRPMHDVPYDSARVVDGDFVSFGAPGAPAGAVRVGGRWVLLEAGQAPLSVERALAALAALDPAPVAAAVVTLPAAGNGGIVRLVRDGVPVHAAPGAVPFAERMLRHHRQPAARLHPAPTGRWVRIGADSLRIEPVDLPDAPGALMVYVPGLRYLYSALAAAPLQREYLLRRARLLGWEVERVGSLRAVTGAP